MAADKVVSLKREKEAGGRIKWALLYLYDISADSVVDDDDVKVIPQTSGNIPTEVVGKLATEIAAINVGDMIYQQTGLHQTIGESDPAFVARIKSDFAGAKTFFHDRFKDQWERVGYVVDPNA